jgi:flagellar hook-basal body complex protein FliE
VINAFIDSISNNIDISKMREITPPFTFKPGSEIPSEPALKTTFESFFNSAIEILNETNRFQLRAEQFQTDLATGKTDDILAVLMAQDRAFSSLNFTVQVTNKIIEAYREIMRMQM